MLSQALPHSILAVALQVEGVIIITLLIWGGREL